MMFEARGSGLRDAGSSFAFGKLNVIVSFAFQRWLGFSPRILCHLNSLTAVINRPEWSHQESLDSQNSSAISENENSRLIMARSPTNFVSLIQKNFLRSTASMGPRRTSSNSKKVVGATSEMPSVEDVGGVLIHAGTLPSTSPPQGPPCRGEC